MELIIYFIGLFITLLLACTAKGVKEMVKEDGSVIIASICALVAMFWPVTILVVIAMNILEWRCK